MKDVMKLLLEDSALRNELRSLKTRKEIAQLCFEGLGTTARRELLLILAECFDYHREWLDPASPDELSFNAYKTQAEILAQRIALELLIDELNQQLSDSTDSHRRSEREVVRLRQLQDFDAKSGLANYQGIRHWSTYMSGLIIRNRMIAAISFLDFNWFKKINDSWGHAVGDQIIELTGRYLNQTIEISENAGRFGGEEFVIGNYARKVGHHDPLESIRRGLTRILGGLTPYVKEGLAKAGGPDIYFIGVSAGSVIISPPPLEEDEEERSHEAPSQIISLIWTPSGIKECEKQLDEVPPYINLGDFTHDNLGEALIRMADSLMYESKALFHAQYPELSSDRQ